MNTFLRKSGDIIKTLQPREDLAGSKGSGTHGDKGQIYTLTTTEDVEIDTVYLDGFLLVETTHYIKDNNAKTVKIINNVFDSQIVSIFYDV